MTRSINGKTKSQNIWHLSYIREMEERIASRDRLQREERSQRQQHTPPQAADPVVANRARRRGSYTGVADGLADVVNRVNGLIAQRFYCPIEGRYHHCSEQTKEKLVTNAFATLASTTEEKPSGNNFVPWIPSWNTGLRCTSLRSVRRNRCVATSRFPLPCTSTFQRNSSARVCQTASGQLRYWP